MYSPFYLPNALSPASKVEDINYATANYYRDSYTFTDDELESLVENLRSIRIYRELEDHVISTGVNSSLTIYTNDGQKYHIICDWDYITINTVHYSAAQEPVIALTAQIKTGVEKLFEINDWD